MNKETYDQAKELQTKIKYHTKLKEAIQKDGNSIGVLNKPQQFFDLNEKPFDQESLNNIKRTLIAHCDTEIEKAQSEFDVLQEVQMKVE